MGRGLCQNRDTLLAQFRAWASVTGSMTICASKRSLPFYLCYAAFYLMDGACPTSASIVGLRTGVPTHRFFSVYSAALPRTAFEAAVAP